MKPLTELTLLDRFLFDEVMEHSENMQTMLEIILGKEISLKYLPQTEREERSSPQYRFIKLDVWAEDMEDTIYDTEVQKQNTKNLPKRSRYYQGLIDSKLLEPGILDFNDLNDLFVIIITPFDLFGENKYCYTFHMECEEVPNLRLPDGATRIFLNTHGTNDSDVSDDLIELLHLIEHTNDNQKEYRNHHLNNLLKRVRKIQSNAEVSVRYMQAWEEKILEQQEAKKEGIEEGMRVMISSCKKLGITYNEVKKQIMDGFHLSEEKAEHTMQKYWK